MSTYNVIDANGRIIGSNLSLDDAIALEQLNISMDIKATVIEVS